MVTPRELAGIFAVAAVWTAVYSVFVISLARPGWLSRKRGEEQPAAGPREVTRGDRIITFGLLIAFALFFAAWYTAERNPPWFDRMTATDRDAEAIWYLGIANTHVRKGEYPLAIQEYKQALKKAVRPTRKVEICANMGITYAQMGMANEAVDVLKQALALNTESPYLVYYNLGEVCRNAGRIDDAIACYAQAAEMDPFPVPTYLNLANLYMAKQQWDNASDTLGKALRFRCEMKNYLAGALKRDVQSYEAEPDVQAAVRALVAKGVAPDDLAPYDAVLFQRLLATDREVASIHNALGYACGRKGDATGAIQHFRAALLAWPDFDAARANLQAVLEATNQKNNPAPQQ